MSKYLIKRGQDQLRIALTPIGAVLEGVSGFILALPWCFLGTAVIFIPEIYMTLRGDSLSRFSWSFVLVICLLCALGFGIRRATRVAFWDFDKSRCRVQMQTRTILGGQGELFEADFKDVSALKLERRSLVILMNDAPPLTVARSWLSEQELIQLEREISGLLTTC